MWFFMTKPGKFRAKLYLHPNENDVGFHIESLKTTKFPKFSWNVSVFVNQFHERKWVLQLARVIGNIGKKIIVVANLKPAVLCGVESNGMILASGEGDQIKVVFLDDDTPLGQRVR